MSIIDDALEVAQAVHRAVGPGTTKTQEIPPETVALSMSRRTAAGLKALCADVTQTATENHVEFQGLRIYANDHVLDGWAFLLDADGKVIGQIQL